MTTTKNTSVDTVVGVECNIEMKQLPVLHAHCPTITCPFRGTEPAESPHTHD